MIAELKTDMNTKIYNTRESGFVFPLVAIVAVAICGLVFLAINQAYVSVARNQLQAAADAAAHAGAKALCPTDACWDQARKDAIYVLNQYSVLGGVSKGSVSYNIVPAAPSPATPDQTNWQLSSGDLTVNIQRGRWISNTFETMEDADILAAQWNRRGMSWQEAYPGLPRMVATNAVRVSINLSGINILGIRAFTPISYKATASATATKGELQTNIPIAPFALPVCSIMTTQPDPRYPTDPELYTSRMQDSREICNHERLFTQSARYCSSDTECNVIPRFPYYYQLQFGRNATNVTPSAPLSSFTFNNPAVYASQQCVLNQQIFDSNFNSGATYNAGQDGYPNNISQGLVFREIEDNYGVIGIPISGDNNGNQRVEENEIRQKLQNAVEPYFRGQLGERFLILPGGLTQQQTGNLLWQRITGTFANPPTYNTFAPSDPFHSRLDLMADPYYGNPPQPGSRINFFYNIKSCPVQNPPITNPLDVGFCGSRRLALVQAPTTPQPEIFVGGCGYDFLQDGGLNQTNNRTFVMKINIPIIADITPNPRNPNIPLTIYDQNAPEPCNALFKPSELSRINPNFMPQRAALGNTNRNWRIIGFVQAQIVDTDVGLNASNPSLQTPAQLGCSAAQPVPNPGNPLTFDQAPWLFTPSMAPGNGGTGTPAPAATPAAAAPCNVTRGHVMCGSTYLFSNTVTSLPQVHQVQ